jgi:hypothetical protein
MTEAAIRQRVEDLASAFRARDIETLMSLYVPVRLLRGTGGARYDERRARLCS